MRGFSSISFSFASIIFITVTTQFSDSQFFDPKLDDKNYLDSIQNQVLHDVQESKTNLLDQAKVVQHVTRNYIAARLKQNLFKALRVLAEKELAIDEMSMADRPRQPRQEEEVEAGGVEAGGVEPGGVEPGGVEEELEPATTRKPSQILPQVANLIKAVFGGNINLTSYVESAATYLPKPIGNQLVGVVKLLANNPGSKYTTTTTTTTPAPTTTINTTAGPVTTVVVKSKPVTATQLTELPLTTFAPPFAPTKEDEEDGDEDSRAAARQIEIPGLDILGNIGGNVASILNAGNALANVAGTFGKVFQPENVGKAVDTLGNVGEGVLQTGGALGKIAGTLGNIFSTNANSKDKVAESDKRDVKSTTPNATSSGFEEESSSKKSTDKMNGIDVANLAKEVRMGMVDLIKVMPDLFRGAHEAYKLLNSVSSLFQRLEVES